MPWEKQFDVDDALEQAMQAFWGTGFEATSTQNLLDRMGINRGSLYDTFGNKNALFRRALERYLETRQGRRIAEAGRQTSAREAILSIFAGLAVDVVERGNHNGCFLVNTALERAPHDANIAEIVTGGFSEMEQFLHATIARGQETGEIPAHVDVETTARALLTMILGLRVLSRSGDHAEVFAAVAETATDMLS